MSYISGQAGCHDGCIFDFSKDVSFDKEALLLYKGRYSEVLLNRFPYANGHLLVAPVRHVADLTDLSPAESADLMTILQESTTILRRYLHPDGLNVGLNLGAVAGAGQADHLHFHIVPRWEGDHNFMTVTADIRSIPQHIDHTFTDLLPDFQALRNNVEAKK
jgi:ATP adenylyltransferase